VSLNRSDTAREFTPKNPVLAVPFSCIDKMIELCYILRLSFRIERYFTSKIYPICIENYIRSDRQVFSWLCPQVQSYAVASRITLFGTSITDNALTDNGAV
jgi:hypothetical protein